MADLFTTTREGRTAHRKGGQRLSKKDRSFLLSGVPLLGIPSSCSISFGTAACVPEPGGRASCIGPLAFAGLADTEEKAAKSPKSSSSLCPVVAIDACADGTAEPAIDRPNPGAGTAVTSASAAAFGLGPAFGGAVKSPKSSSSEGAVAGETARLAPGKDGGGGRRGGATVEPAAEAGRARGRTIGACPGGGSILGEGMRGALSPP